MIPTPKSAHIDAALSNIAIGYNAPMFIADRVFPHIPVNKQSDKFFKFLKGDWFRMDADVRGAGSEARQGGYKLTSGSYSAIEYALSHPVPIELINNADDPLNPLKTAVEYVTRQIQLRKEYQVASLCTTAANWTSSEDAAAGWVATADGSGNTFIADMFSAKRTVRKLIGVNPNVLVVDDKTWDNIIQEYTVLERIKYSMASGEPASVTTNMIAQMFGLDEVLIGSAIYSSDEETVAGTEFTAVDMWETNATKGSALLLYRTPTPAINQPNAGYIFEWNGGMGQPNEVLDGDVYRSVRRWWDAGKKAWMIEGSETFDEKVTCKDAGFLFYDTIVT